MSFGSQIGHRRQADAGSRIARLTRRALLTGGCAAAGWIGVSLLGGGAAHAATAQPADQSPVSAIVNQLPADKHQNISGLTDLAQRTISAHSTRSVHLTSIQKSIGDVDQRLPKSIADQLGKATKPVTDQVVTPVAKAAKQATQPLTKPLAADNPISQTVSSVQKPLHQLTSTLHRTTADLHLPGISVPTSRAPRTPHLPVHLSPVAQHLSPAMHQQHAGRHHAKATHHANHRATGQAVPTAAGIARAAGHSEPRLAAARSVVVPVRAVRHPVHLRIPAPNAPPAPGVPAPNAGTGSGTSGSSSVGGAAVGALDSAAEAGFRALGTVDPTDAGMARCVAQRPSTSPD